MLNHLVNDKPTGLDYTWGVRTCWLPSWCLASNLSKS